MANKENEEGKDMHTILKKEMSFTEFIKNNKQVIKKITDSNTVINNNGLTVVTKDDPWRNEDEWNKIIEKSKNNK